ncbi:E3 ubiquitin-protein ligase sina-like isoform X1 [Folsomia candida]|uniref:E3 ubiquitin-protein ligase sina-like isoform X1 n=1 Tax=Folsomia candida TaxID=158441 RepID=UPI001604CA44|nr:E3 ubiquitin-protein ligase sina-like isoform X1 [Folsomia candida]
MVESRAPRDLGDFLNCTICLDEPASPIHSCANGHIICGICVEKVKKCGLCQADLKMSDLAERLSRQFDFKLTCGNENEGCKEIVAAAEMKTHLKNCYYREIICTEFKNEVCGKAEVAMSDYAKHLQDRHKCIGGTRNFTLMLTDGNIVHEAGALFPIGILEKDGKVFLQLSHIGEDASVYFWMTVLGSKETAEEYMFDFEHTKAGRRRRVKPLKCPLPGQILTFQNPFLSSVYGRLPAPPSKLAP